MVPWVLQVPKFRGSNGAGVDGAAGGVGVGLAGVSVVGGVGALGIDWEVAWVQRKWVAEREEEVRQLAQGRDIKISRAGKREIVESRKVCMPVEVAAGTVVGVPRRKLKVVDAIVKVI